MRPRQGLGLRLVVALVATLGLSGCLHGEPVTLPVAYQYSEPTTVTILLPACTEQLVPPAYLEFRGTGGMDGQAEIVLVAAEGDFDVRLDDATSLWQIELPASSIPDQTRTAVDAGSEGWEVAWFGQVILDQTRPAPVDVRARGEYEGFPEPEDFTAAPADVPDLFRGCSY